jgi:hypothetical protein
MTCHSTLRQVTYRSDTRASKPSAAITIALARGDPTRNLPTRRWALGELGNGRAAREIPQGGNL